MPAVSVLTTSLPWLRHHARPGGPIDYPVAARDFAGTGMTDEEIFADLWSTGGEDYLELGDGLPVVSSLAVEVIPTDYTAE